MSDEKKPDPYYQKQANDLVNLLYDKRFLADDVARESMDKLEGFIAFILQSTAESAVRAHDLVKSFRDPRKGSE